MRGRCERHQLALGPSGCLICRREQAAGAASAALPQDVSGASAEPARAASATPSLEPRRLNVQISPWALLVPAAALGIYLASAARSSIELERAAHAGGSAAVAPAAAAPASEAEPVSVLADDAHLRAPARALAPAPAEAELEAEDSFEPASAALRGESQRIQEPTRVSEAERERQLANARELVDVTVYYTSWCPACRAARSYLSERGIRFVEHDVENDPRAKSRQKLLNPRGSIPTIDIEGQVLVGFDPTKIERAIDHAARQRLAR
jgi:glutaredoxin